jgi:hypothetical protein
MSFTGNLQFRVSENGFMKFLGGFRPGGGADGRFEP